MDILNSSARHLAIWTYSALRATATGWRATVPGLVGAVLGWWLASYFRQVPFFDELFVRLGLPPGLLNVIAAVVSASAAISIFKGTIPGPPADRRDGNPRAAK